MRTMILLAAALLLQACNTHPNRQALNAFLKANSQAQAMEQVAPEFQLNVLSTDGSTRTLNRAQLEDAIAWDLATNTQFRYERLLVDDSKATGFFSEESDFYRLLDTNGWLAQLTFHFNDQSRIRSIDYVPLSEQKDLADTMSAFVNWALTERPAELGAVYPDGQIVRSGESAQRWIALLQDWRAATGRPTIELNM
ncbi:MAG: hypothetical protein AAGK04_02395 [Planctomycetota bacterium]